ncbi:MAG: hypothetical protein AAF125_20875, partial [Chloroflexota bacterium]
ATDLLDAIRKRHHDAVGTMSHDDVALLLMSHLEQQGYRLAGQLPWTEVHAYRLLFDMPLNMQQSGTLVMLGKHQQRGVITSQVQHLVDLAAAGPNDADEMERLSDFMIVLDLNRYDAVRPTYERSTSAGRLSPSVRVLGRKALEDMTFIETLRLLAERGVLARDEVTEDVIHGYLQEHDLLELWIRG